MRQIIAERLRRVADWLDGRPVPAGPIFQNATPEELRYLQKICILLEQDLAHPGQSRGYLFVLYRELVPLLAARAR